MIKLILSGSIAVMIAALSFSCGSSSPSDPVITDGAWSGTVLGQPITFTVEGNQVKDLHLTFVYWGVILPVDTVTWTPGDAAISNNEFHMTDSLTDGYYSYSLNIDGTFDPPSNVSGILYTVGAYDSLGSHVTSSDSLSWSGTHN